MSKYLLVARYPPKPPDVHLFACQLDLHNLMSAISFELLVKLIHPCQKWKLFMVICCSRSMDGEGKGITGRKKSPEERKRKKMKRWEERKRSCN